MANVIAIAHGHNENSSTKCSRLASKEAEVQASTRRTSVRATVTKDGRVEVFISRNGAVLTHVTVNSEHAEDTTITADGLLRETIALAAMDDLPPAMHARQARTLDSDIAEDR